MELTVALRYTTEKRGVIGQQEVIGPTGSSLGLSYAPVDASKRFNKLTWRLAVSQQLAENAMLYASYNWGLKAGSFNGQAPNLRPLIRKCWMPLNWASRPTCSTECCASTLPVLL